MHDDLERTDWIDVADPARFTAALHETETGLPYFPPDIVNRLGWLLDQACEVPLPADVMSELKRRLPAGNAKVLAQSLEQTSSSWQLV